MPQYEVTWVIEVDEPNPLMAAREVRDIQLDRTNEATCFTVMNQGTGEVTDIDLLEDDPDYINE